MRRFRLPDNGTAIDCTGPHTAVPRIGVVMGGGALKGLAHVGALRAIRGWFSFTHVEQLLQLGYDSTRRALTHLLDTLAAPGGIFPREQMEIRVDRDRCTGCGLCAAHHPALMVLDPSRRAYPLQPVHDFSPADAAFAGCCPTQAIEVSPVSVIAPVGTLVSDELAQLG